VRESKLEIRKKRPTLGAFLFCAELAMISLVQQMRGANRLGLCGLSEGDPESVAITNDEFTHIVESIVKVFDDMNLVFKVSVQVIDVVRRYVEVDLATVFGARFPAYIEHQFAVSKRQLRPVDFAILLVLSN
jgi:hypothetical protein